MDPILVLSGDNKHWLIRVAAHNVVLKDQKAAAEKAKNTKGR